MTGPADQPTKPVRTWRPMVLWTAAILLALLLLSLAAVPVVSFFQVRGVLAEWAETWKQDGVCTGGLPPASPEAGYIARLGGPERALKKLECYLRAPRAVAHRRGAAVGLLGWCGQPAVPGLMRLLSDNDPLVRTAAMEALAQIGPDAAEAMPLLLAGLDSSDPSTCSGAARALGAIGPSAREAIPRLEQLLGHGTAYVRYDAAFALAKLGDRRSVSPIAKLLASANEDDRCCGAMALGRMGGVAQAAVDALSANLSDSSERVRRHTAEALKKIRGE